MSFRIQNVVIFFTKNVKSLAEVLEVNYTHRNPLYPHPQFVKCEAFLCLLRAQQQCIMAASSGSVVEYLPGVQKVVGSIPGQVITKT